MKKKITDDDKFIVDIHYATKDTKKIRNQIIPAVFKKYKNAKKIKLSKNFKKSNLIVEDAIVRRKSRRNYSGIITLEQVSKLLYYSKGFKEIVDSDEFGIVQMANVPSAGARHPIELYVILRNVKGINDGIYHYDIENHQLETIKEKKFAKYQIYKLVNRQEELANANIVLFMTAIHSRSSWKYGPRAYRFIHLDAGHIGQNVYLISEAMGLGACAVGVWQDKAVEKLLKIDGERELIVYAIVIGKRNKKGI